MAAALVGKPPTKWQSIVIEDYDPAWVDRFAAASSALSEILGERVISIEHVGSTSVPGLAAKPIIDIDLLIEDTAQETRYIPALERLGYRLVLREPWWHGHRMLVSPEEDVHLHVWPQTAPEPIRHRLFRDWLRSRAEDRDLYATTKRRLARTPRTNLLTTAWRRTTSSTTSMRASSQHAAQWAEADPRHGDTGFILREYLCVDGALRQALISRGIVILGRKGAGQPDRRDVR